VRSADSGTCHLVEQRYQLHLEQLCQLPCLLCIRDWSRQDVGHGNFTDGGTKGKFECSALPVQSRDSSKCLTLTGAIHVRAHHAIGVDGRINAGDGLVKCL